MTATLPSQKALEWLYRFLATASAQTLGSYLATSLVTGFNRAVVLLVVFPLITMLVCATDRVRSRYNILIMVAATVTSLVTIHFLRYRFNLDWFVGPCPPDMEFPGYAILTIITIACAGGASRTKLFARPANPTNNIVIAPTTTHRDYRIMSGTLRMWNPYNG